MVELCEVVDLEGRVVGGEELEAVGGLGGGRLGFAGQASGQQRSTGHSRSSMSAMSEDDTDLDDGMEMG